MADKSQVEKLENQTGKITRLNLHIPKEMVHALESIKEDQLYSSLSHTVVEALKRFIAIHKEERQEGRRFVSENPMNPEDKIRHNFFWTL